MKKLVTLALFFFSICANAQKSYKGAELYSSKTWKYGKIEVRMKMAKGSGLLSTFFTYKDGSEIAGTFWEEIDIEVLGKNNAQAVQSNIITNNPKETSEELHTPGFSLADDYHTYTLEWTPNYLAWYLDGKELRKSQGGQVSDLTNPQSFRFNIWAANIPAWVGVFDPAALPAYQFVNWIKYSAYTPGTGNNGADFTLNWQDDFNTFNSARWGKANWTFGENLADFDPANVVIKDGYLVLVLSKAGETGFTGTVPTDDLVSSLESESLVSDMEVFPNPTASTLLLKGKIEGEWSLYDVVGEKLAHGQNPEIDLGSYTNGIYFLHVNKTVKRIVKR